MTDAPAQQPRSAAAQGVARDVRLCVVGDSTVTGYGDPKALGWLGRVVARTPSDQVDLTVHNLGVRGDSTSGVLARWRSECDRRWFPGADNRLVVACGAADAGQGISLARTRLNLANVLDDATSEGLHPFVVGPAPFADRATHAALRTVADAERDVCSRRGIPFVDCFEPLLQHEQWYADLEAGDGIHPGQAGYGLLAWLVLHGGWATWLGVDV